MELYKDRVYHKMCEKAKKLQKNHIPQHDDYYLYEDFRGMSVKSIDERDKAVMETVKDCTWIPTVSQLYNIFWPELDTLAQIQSVWIFINSFKLEPESHEQAVLLAGMYQKYNKKWNGNDWIKK